MKQKKNKFFTWVLSFMPGAAEMYMGFMKSGISLMGLFFVSIMIPSVFHFGDVFILLAVLVWFYSFFHARNLATYNEGPLCDLHDEFIWESFGGGLKMELPSPVLRKWLSIGLIVVGAGMLWGTLEDAIYLLIPDRLWHILSPVVELVPQLAVSVFIIYIGVKLIMGKKEALEANGSESEN